MFYLAAGQTSALLLLAEMAQVERYTAGPVGVEDRAPALGAWPPLKHRQGDQRGPTPLVLGPVRMHVIHPHWRRRPHPATHDPPLSMSALSRGPLHLCPP